MGCTILPSIDMVEIERNKQSIQEAALKTSQEVMSGGNQIKMIKKQHDITEVAFAGNGWFNSNGKLYFDKKPKKHFKYKIGYRNRFNRDEHIWCFN